VNREERQPPAFVWTGFESTFRRAGFEEIARRSPTRPILRKPLGLRPRATRKTAMPRAKPLGRRPRAISKPPHA